MTLFVLRQFSYSDLNHICGVSKSAQRLILKDISDQNVFYANKNVIKGQGILFRNNDKTMDLGFPTRPIPFSLQQYRKLAFPIKFITLGIESKVNMMTTYTE